MMVVVMIATIVRENTTLASSSSSRPQVLPSVLLIGKKYAVEYIIPALFRLNTTGELVIKAIGSLNIVTAADVAKLVKRDVGDLVTKSITVGTDELTVVGDSGISKRMSCIEIHLAKDIAAAAATATAATATKKKASRKKEEEIGRLAAHTPAFSYIFRFFCCYSFFITITSFFSCLESMMAFSAGYGVTRDIVLGNSTVSLMSSTFVIQRIKRSMPSPKPPCGTEPNLRRSRYQS
jgi:DNA-binding protein Alba